MAIEAYLQPRSVNTVHPCYSGSLSSVTLYPSSLRHHATPWVSLGVAHFASKKPLSIIRGLILLPVHYTCNSISIKIRVQLLSVLPSVAEQVTREFRVQLLSVSPLVVEQVTRELLQAFGQLGWHHCMTTSAPNADFPAWQQCQAENKHARPNATFKHTPHTPHRDNLGQGVMRMPVMKFPLLATPHNCSGRTTSSPTDLCVSALSSPSAHGRSLFRTCARAHVLKNRQLMCAASNKPRKKHAVLVKPICVS